MPLNEDLGGLSPTVIVRFYRNEGDPFPYMVSASEGGPEAAAMLRRFLGRLPAGEYPEVQVFPDAGGNGAERVRATPAAINRIAASVETRPPRGPSSLREP